MCFIRLQGKRLSQWHSQRLIASDRIERPFTLFVPFGDGSETCFDPGPPATARPLVLNWHGCNRHLPVIDYHLDISRMNERAADFSWFTITPLGTTLLNTSGDILGNYGWDAHGCCPCHEIGIDDFAFANALLDWAQAHLCVDMSNVFTTGFSNGAFMSYSLGCKLAERFAEIAVNAESIYRSPNVCAQSVMAVLNA